MFSAAVLAITIRPVAGLGISVVEKSINPLIQIFPADFRPLAWISYFSISMVWSGPILAAVLSDLSWRSFPAH